MRAWLRRLLPALVLLGAAAALLAVWRAWPVEVVVARAERAVPVEVFGLGTVEARIRSEIGFETAGTLVEWLADHGDRVARGQLLARLDPSQQRARLAKAEAAARAAEATVQRARAGLERAAALEAQKRQASQRRQALVARGAVSTEAAEDAQTEEAVARAEVGLARGELAVAEAALGDARAQLEVERVALARHELRAPYDALVVRRHRELGVVLAPGAPVLTLVDPTSIWAVGHVDEALAGGLAQGQEAVVRRRSQPLEPHRARVVRIDLESDRLTEERRVSVECEACPLEVHLGEQTEIVVRKGVLEEALLVPLSVVDGFDGEGGTLWTLEEGRLARRRVGLGARLLDGRVEVLDGLPPGAEPVVAARGTLREGARARPAPEPPR